MYKSSAIVLLATLAVVHLVPGTSARGGLAHETFRRFAEELNNDVNNVQEQEPQQEVRDLVNIAETEKVKKTLRDFSGLLANYLVENADKEFQPQISLAVNDVAEHEFTDMSDFVMYWAEIARKIYEPIFKQLMSFDDDDSSESKTKDSDEW